MGAADFLTWLSDTTIATSALIVLVLLIRRPVARRFGAEAAYLLWLAPALRLATPDLAILPAPPAVIAEPTLFSPAMAAEAIAAAEPATDLSFALAMTWAVGAAAFVLWQFGAQFAFRRRLLAMSAPAPEPMRAEAATVAWRRGYKRRYDLRIADGEVGPLVIGLRRPLIILPASFAAQLTSHERQMALAHEFAHVARGDLFAAFLATLLRAVQWFNPFAHVAWRAFRADQEAACDALVLRRSADDPAAAHVYAEAMVKAARGPAPDFALSIAFSLKERLVLMKTVSKTRPALARTAALCAVIAGVAASASYSYADEKKGAAPDPDAASNEPRVEAHRVVLVGSDKEVKSHDGKHVVMIRKASDGSGARDAISSAPRIIVLDSGDGAKTIRLGGEDIVLDGADCKDAEGNPAKPLFEGAAETADGEPKIRDRMIFCSKGGEAADPKKQAEALRKALAGMQEDARREAEARQKMIAALEARIAELEKKAK